MQATSSAPAGDSPATGEGEISTFGWDTAFAVRIENVNAAIAARSASPPAFDYVDPADANVFAKGQFGEWSVVRGGDGDGVNIQLPILGVTGQMKASTGYTPYSCAGATIVVQVRLSFFELQPNQQNLKVRPSATSTDVPAVELYSADFSQYPVQPPGAVYALQAAVMAWCANNLGAFEYVFSIVTINDEADQGAWAFLKPTAVSYAYVDGPDDADAFLGVLAMTTGEDPGNLQQVLDARIVQPNEEGAFCISRSLILQKLIFPNLQGLWPNLSASQVTFTEDSIQLNTNESVDLPPVTYQGTQYTPQLQQLTLTIEGNQLSIDAYTVTQVQDGVQAWCRSTPRYTIIKSTNKSGQTTLAYQKLPGPDPSHGHYIDESVEITDIILALVLGIALAAVAVLTGGAAGVVIAVIGALLVGLIAMSAQISGLIENNDAPPIDMLQANTVAPTVWTDSKDFAIDAVDLNGSMRLGGSLGFGSATAG